MAPYKSKVDRLNVECADPYLLQNCVHGQKWHCVNENGRWRKHKCKFHAQLQSHLDAITQFTAQNKRNCACFTTEGVVYTKIHSPNPRKSNTLLRQKRSTNGFDDFISNLKALKQINNKIDDQENLEIHPELVNFYPELYSIQKGINAEIHALRSKRSKRDVHQTSSIIEDLQRALNTVENKFTEKSIDLEHKYQNGSDFKANLPAAKCYVRGDGRVNCSNVVYEDEKAWRQSRQQIDAIIDLLKSKLSDLKDIKKHLRENRPAGVKDYEVENTSYIEDYTEGKENVEQYNEELLNMENNRRTHHISEHGAKRNKNHASHKLNKPKLEGPLIDSSLFVTSNEEQSSTTEIPIRHKNHSNKHKHHHKHHSSTTVSPELAIDSSYYDEDYESIATSAPKKIKHPINFSTNERLHTKPTTSTTTQKTDDIHSTKGIEYDENNEENEGEINIISSQNPSLSNEYSTTLGPTTETTKPYESVVESVSTESTIHNTFKHRHHNKHHNQWHSNNAASRNNESIHEHFDFNSHHSKHSQKKINSEAAECYCEPEVER